jgi:hypothetical protein
METLEDDVIIMYHKEMYMKFEVKELPSDVVNTQALDLKWQTALTK